MAIRKGEAMSALRIIREYEPFNGRQGRRTWRVKGEDGKQPIVAEGRMESGEGMLVTMYKKDRGKPLPYSQKKAPVESHQKGFPPLAVDTAGGMHNLRTRSQQGVNAPDNAGTKTVGENEENVKGGRAEAEAMRLVEEGRYEAGEANELRDAIEAAERVGVRENAVLSAFGCIMGAL